MEQGVETLFPANKHGYGEVIDKRKAVYPNTADMLVRRDGQRQGCTGYGQR